MADIFIIDSREESRGRDYIKKIVNRAIIDAGLSLDTNVYAGRSVSEIRSSNGLASGENGGKGGLFSENMVVDVFKAEIRDFLTMLIFDFDMITVSFKGSEFPYVSVDKVMELTERINAMYNKYWGGDSQKKRG